MNPSAVLFRALALAAAVAASTAALPLLFPGDALDANIGAGFVPFGLVALVALVGGVLDGRRLPLGHLTVTWLLASAVVGVVWAVVLYLVQVAQDGVYSGLLTYLTIFPPITVVVAVPPAWVGAALGRLTRSRPAPADGRG